MPYNMKMLKRPLVYPRVVIWALLFALFCVGVGGMEATDSACRVLVGMKLKSRKDILLDTKVQFLLRVIILPIFLQTKRLESK